jgi:hypothetical protein
MFRMANTATIHSVKPVPPIEARIQRALGGSVQGECPILRKGSIDSLMKHVWPDDFPELQTAINTFAAIGEQAIPLAAIRTAVTTSKPDGDHRYLLLKETTRVSSLQAERRLIPKEALIKFYFTLSIAWGAKARVDLAGFMYRLKPIFSRTIDLFRASLKSWLRVAVTGNARWPT